MSSLEWEETCDVTVAQLYASAIASLGDIADVRRSDWATVSNATHQMILGRFFEECGRENPKFLRTRRNLFVDEHNRLCYSQNRSAARYGVGESEIAVLAEYIGKRHKGGILLLNGDGLNSFDSQQWQTTIRDEARRAFGEARTPGHPVRGSQRGSGGRTDTQAHRGDSRPAGL
jgi:hypothetical protein